MRMSRLLAMLADAERLPGDDPRSRRGFMPSLAVAALLVGVGVALLPSRWAYIPLLVGVAVGLFALLPNLRQQSGHAGQHRRE